MKRRLNSKSLEKLLPEQKEPGTDRRISAEGGMRILLADLKASSGAWVTLSGGDVLLDGAQAGGVLGFNAGACFGVTQYLESWTGETDTETFALLKSAFDAFQARKPGRGMDVDDTVTEHPAQLARSYIQFNVLDQFDDQVVNLEQSNRELMTAFCQKHLGLVTFGHAGSLSASFDCGSEPMAAKLCQSAIAAGILLPPNTDRTVNIRMNLAWTPETATMFWQRMEHVASSLFGGSLTTNGDCFVSLRDPSGYLRFHQAMIRHKLGMAKGRTAATTDSAIDTVLAFVNENLKSPGLEDCLAVIVSPENWPQYRAAVEDLQCEVYEPARQTPMEKFDKLLRSPSGMAMLLLQGNRIIAISFAGPLGLFPGERGTLDDPWRTDPDALYMLDVTVRKEFRGSLGRLMKQAVTLLAVVSGCSAIHGRNRDRLAAGMWAINLSVGSFQIRHLVDDYPDEEEFRDCIYYRCPLQWTMPAPNTAAFRQIELLAAMPSEQLQFNIARLANGYPPILQSLPAPLTANLVPIPCSHHAPS